MLTATSKYALRALAYMAGLADGKAVLQRDLAKNAHIPANYLYKVLLTLKNGGILAANRGIGGGYSLRKKPNEIHLVDVVALFEGVNTEPTCILDDANVCSDHAPCSAHSSWRRVKMLYMRFLEQTSIAEIAEHKGSDKNKKSGKKKIGTGNFII
jgi:Rrf2 family protein